MKRASSKVAPERLHLDYEILEILNKLEESDFDPVTHSDLQEKILKDKREYRRRLREESEPEYFRGTNGKVVATGGDYDHFWVKVFFEGERWSKEEMKEFTDAIWIRCMPSQYDCTGQLFTWAVDCFNVDSGVVVYVREALDV